MNNEGINVNTDTGVNSGVNDGGISVGNNDSSVNVGGGVNVGGNTGVDIGIDVSGGNQGSNTGTNANSDPIKTATQSQWTDLINRVKNAGGSGVTELTTADYNYPTDNPQYVAMWLKDDGAYYAPNGVNAKTYRDDTMGSRGGIMLVREENSLKYITRVQATTMSNNIGHYAMTAVCVANAGTSVGTEAHTVMTGDSINNLTSNESRMPLAAAQGKVLNDKIGDLSTLTTTDKTSAVAAINEIAAGAGGGGVTELTSADYNYPTSNPDGIALWLLPTGIYDLNGLKTYISTSSYSETIHIIVHKLSDSGFCNDFYFEGSSTLHRLQINSAHTQFWNYSMDINLAQSTGTSTTKAMSQNATTSMVYADPANKAKVQIGNNSQATGVASISLGYNSKALKTNTVAIGEGSTANYTNSVAIGKDATPTRIGEVNIGSGSTQNGFNNSEYRVLGGLYDGQSAHDAATVAQGNTLAITTPTTSTVGVLGQLYTDTTNMHTYQCTAIDDTTDPNNPVYTWTMRW